MRNLWNRFLVWLGWREAPVVPQVTVAAVGVATSNGRKDLTAKMIEEAMAGAALKAMSEGLPPHKVKARMLAARAAVKLSV